MAPVHHTVWMKAMDDSLEAFLNQPSQQAAE
jgi:trimethylamine monooxygenase